MRFQHNQFSVLRKDEFVSFPNLISLWLDENQIEHIDQEALRLPNLRNLYLRANRITFISETRLDLSNNFIFALRSRNFFYSFAPLTNLVDLNLADNALTVLPTESLKGFKWKKLCHAVDMLL
ncbi:LRR 1 and LRR 8 domain containing protein [Trichuris trichiura]|uniref:LRR 1 and LRR 8 domain containing protein n=1 Tax=Trichuris trichiura TaxID=36087 RepID=A0A077ZGY7_TRITR|nr:LRR 1 and LRR 8 domain containing protein [Trichuris trichiura]